MSDRAAGDWGVLIVIACIAGGIWWLNSGSRNNADPNFDDYPLNVAANLSAVPAATAAPAAAVAPVPAVPLHNYEFEDDGLYGYVAVVSEEDRVKGRVTGRLSLFAYRGRAGGIHRLSMYDDAMRKIGDYQCENPCRVIRSVAGDTVLRRIPYNPSSILGSAVQDAIAGRLRIHVPQGEQRRRLAPEQGENVAAALPPLDDPLHGNIAASPDNTQSAD